MRRRTTKIRLLAAAVVAVLLLVGAWTLFRPLEKTHDRAFTSPLAGANAKPTTKPAPPVKESRQQPEVEAESLFEAKELRAKTGTRLAADLHLIVAVAQKNAGQNVTAQVTPDELSIMPESRLLDIMRDADGRVGVQVRARDVKTIEPHLEKLGFRKKAAVPEYNLIEGFIPVDRLLDLDALAPEGFLSASPIFLPKFSAGAVNTQGMYTLDVDRTQSFRPSNNGAGRKIGVISDSFNFLGGANNDAIGGDLPANGATHAVTIVNGDGAAVPGFIPGDEGRAMLQLVHDIAPNAQLYFATAIGGEATFAQNIRDLAAAGCDIIVDDAVYHAEPFFQDGIIAQAVTDVKEDNGVSYFTSAGNSADRAYEQTSVTSASDTLLPGSYVLWKPADTRLKVTLLAGQRIQISFQWDDPFYTAAGVDTDVDLVLVLEGTTSVVASVTTDNILNQAPVEILEFQNTTGGTRVYDLLARVTTGPSPSRIKFVHLSDDPIVQEFETDSGTVRGHSASNDLSAVAAIHYFDLGKPSPRTSKGDVTILFAPNGTPLGSPETRAKPDFAAVDGTNNTFFGPEDTEGDGFKNFYGTSAAAPHAAAVAALIKNENPSFTPAQVQQAMIDTADPSVGPANLTGAGLISAFRSTYDATEPLLALQPLNFSTGFEEGYLDTFWSSKSTGAGRIFVTDANNPATGTKHLTMDAGVDNFNDTALNEVVVYLNPSGLQDITLRFKEKEFNDTDHPMTGPTFVESENSDGVAFSINGITWIRVVSLTGANSTNTYSLKEFNLSQIAAANGIPNLGGESQLLIKFQQYGDKSISVNGIAFDDISVSGVPATPGVAILQTGGSTNVTESGIEDTYQVFLNTVPSDPVQITVTPDSQIDLGLGDGVPIVLTFPASAAAQTPQTVSVRARDDLVVEGSHVGVITHAASSPDAAYNGIPIPNVNVGIGDNDLPANSLVVTNTNDSGPGSLRAALLSASDPGQTYTITFQNGLTGTIALASPLPALDKNIMVLGPGADRITVSGANAHRVFEVAGTANVEISGLKIANGSSSGSGAGVLISGAGTLKLSSVVLNNNIASSGGAISNAAGGTVELLDSTISDNRGSLGGGILNVSSVVILRRCIVSGNRATGTHGGGINTVNGTVRIIETQFLSNEADNYGGAIYVNNTTTEISLSRFEANRASESGGAIYKVIGDVSIETTTFRLNDSFFGGAIYVLLGPLRIETSLFELNTATAATAGILNQAGSLEIRSSTFTQNEADTGVAVANAGSGSALMEHCTVAGNKAEFGGGGLTNSGPTFTLLGNIIHGNTTKVGSGPNVLGLFTGAKYNLFGNTTGLSLDTEASNNLMNVDPQLGSLDDNGGPTKTMAINPASPAVNAGVPPAENPPSTDQRGALRSYNGRADIGAFEVLDAAATRVDTVADVVNNNYAPGNVSLREAIAAAAFGGDVTFDSSLFNTATPQTIVLVETLRFTKNIEIEGPGATAVTISANNAFRAVDIDEVRVKLAGVTISNGNATGDGGAVEIRDGGEAILEQSVVKNSNASAGGGGVMVNRGTVLRSVLSKIINNTAADDGGGIFNDGGIVVLDRSEVSGNLASEAGGGVATQLQAAQCSIINTLIASNTAGTAGGGVINSQGYLDLYGATLSGNTAQTDGGGALNQLNGDAEVYSSTIIGNTATSGGGGGYFEGGGLSAFKNSLIGGNSAGSVQKDIGFSSGTLLGNANNFVADENGAVGFIFTAGGGSDKSIASLAPSVTQLSDVVSSVLADNGGSARSHELVVQGPLVDQGVTSEVPSALTTDQRGTGFPRVVNGIVDIGSFESEQPEIRVLVDASFDPETGLDGTLIANGTGAHHIGNTAVGYPFTTVFTIDNTAGTRDLNVGSSGSVSIPSGFTLLSWPAGGIVPARGYATFSIRLDATAIGIPGGIVSFNNNDSDENPYTFTVTGDVGDPEIDIKNDANASIPSGGSYAFGTTDAGVPITKTFTIDNTAGVGGALNLTGITVPTGWFLVGQFPATVAPGATATFQLQLHALAAGPQSGVVSIAHNDDDGAPDSNPYTFTVTGSVTPVASYVVSSDEAAGFNTLQAALDGIAGGGVITFDPAMDGKTITPAQTLVLDKDVTIDASDLDTLTISGNGERRVFTINSGVAANLKGLAIIEGAATQGGGILNDGGLLTFLDGSIDDCVATNGGGGLYSTGGSVKLFRATIGTNATSGGNGGGVYISGGVVSIVDSTLSGNQALNGNGGGLFLSAPSAAELLHSTVTANSAQNGGGLFNAGVVACVIGHNLMSGNFASAADLDYSGLISSSGYNIFTDAAVTGTDRNLVSLGKITSDIIDPLLRRNGGRSRTHALQRGSTIDPNPAINSGDDSVIAGYTVEVQEVLETDQDGGSRVIAGQIDIGAKEFFGVTGQVPPPWGFAAADGAVSATFNDDVDPVSLTTENFVVTGSQNGKYTSGAFSSTGPTATYDPTLNFFPGELITASLYQGLASGAGGSGSVFHWQFSAATTDAGTGVFKRDPDFPKVGGQTMWAGYADLNGDHRLDLILIRQGGSHSIYIGDPLSNEFEPEFFGFADGSDLGGPGSRSAAIGDVNGDGRPDVVVVHDGFRPLVVYMQSDSETEVLYNGYDPENEAGDLQSQFGNGDGRAVALADLDGDGDLDAAVGNYNGTGGVSKNDVAFNDGTGNFTLGTPFGVVNNNAGTLVTDLELVDVDLDGDFDIVVSRDSNLPEQCYVNDGTGLFTLKNEFGANRTSALAVGDLTGDTYPDVVCVNGNQFGSGPVTVWVNNGEGEFLPHPNTPNLNSGNFRDVKIADMNGDGMRDIVVMGFNQPQEVWLQTGGGAFSQADSFSDAEFGGNTANQAATHLALADVDVDGDLDALVCSLTENVFFLNTEPIPPVADVTLASNLTTSGGSEHIVEIQYDDNVRVDYSNLDNFNVRVTGPNGYNRNVDLAGLDQIWDAPTIVASYRVLPEGGVWNYQDNGTYQVYVQEGRVPDTSINYVVFTGAPVGSFTVNIPTKEISEVLTTGGSGTGSIGQAVTDVDPGGRIVFDPNLFNIQRTITVDAPIVVNKNLTIVGPGADMLTIKAPEGMRLFEVAPGVTLRLERITVEGSNIGSGNGGTILNNGSVLLYNSHVKGGTTTGEGGGIYNSFGAVLRAVNSAISAGNAGSFGGGIRNVSGGAVQMVNTTVAENISNDSGGGIYNSGVLNLVNCTIAYNACDADMNTVGQGGGIFNNGSTANVVLKNNLIGDNEDRTPVIVDFTGNPDPAGASKRHKDASGNFFNSGNTYNLIRDASGMLGGTTGLTAGNGNKLGTYTGPIRTLIGEFKVWGGETPSCMPLTNSPCVDAGQYPFDLVAAVSWLPAEFQGDMTYDQRGGGYRNWRQLIGKSPFVNNIIDVGAVEFNFRTVVTSLNDTGAYDPTSPLTHQGGVVLRTAVANAQSFGGTVTFAPIHPDSYSNPEPLEGAYRMDMRLGIHGGLIRGVIPINSSVQIVGPGPDKVWLTSMNHDENINQPYLRINGNGASPIKVQVSGLGFRLDGDDQAAFGIEAWGANLTVTDCKFAGAENPESNNPVGVRAIYYRQNGFDGRNGSLNVEGCDFRNFHLGGFFDIACIVARDTRLRIANCVFEDNRGSDSGLAYSGIETATLVENCRFENNETDRGGGAIIHMKTDFRERLSEAAPLVVKNSLFKNNRTDSNAGAVQITAASLHISDTTFENNVAGANGGAIYGWGVNSRLETLNTTFTNNIAEVNGGAIYWRQGAIKLVGTQLLRGSAETGGGLYLESAEADLFNSTFSENTAEKDGGGIFASKSFGLLANSTISLNAAGGNAGGFGASGASSGWRMVYSNVIMNEAAKYGGLNVDNIKLEGALIAQNRAGESPDVNGTVISQTYNLIGDPTGAAITGDSTGNITGVNAPVGPLRSNGGPVKSHDLLFGNPAIDAGDPAFVATDVVAPRSQTPYFTPEGMYTPKGMTPLQEEILLTDKRFYGRTVGTQTDIGAVEYFGVKTPSPDPFAVAPRNVSMSALFNAAIDPASISPSSITVWGKYRGFYNLNPPSGGAFGTIGVDTLALDPNVDFFAGEEVVVYVEPNARYNPDQNPSSPYQWFFRTTVSTTGGGSFVANRETPEFGGMENASSVASGDFDNDGDIDVLAARRSGEGCRIFLNDGTGNLSAGSSFGSADTRKIVVADMNSDGFLDAILGNESGQSEQVFLGDGAGNFTAGSVFGGADTESISVGDVDGDGDLDVIAAHNLALALFANDGAGNLIDHEFNSFGSGGTSTNINYRAVVLGDVDGDGDLDAVVSRTVDGTTHEGEVYLNDGNGHYRTSSVFSAGVGTAIAMGDFEADGDLDVVFAVNGGPAEIYANNGRGEFSANGTLGAAANGTDAALGDMDGDGDLDVILAYNGSTHSVYLNNGSGSFTPHPTTSPFVANATTGITLGDLDGDGDLDLAEVNAGAAGRIWLNSESVAPGCSLSVQNLLESKVAHTFTVTFTDNVRVDVSSIDNLDIRVSGPNGFNALATRVSLDVNSDGTPRTATYAIAGPGGAWNPSQFPANNPNGTYTVSIEENQVFDTSANPVPPATLGTFDVTLTLNDYIVVNTLNSGTGSLRQAIDEVNDGGTVQFSEAVFNQPQTIALLTELAINKNLTIEGPGADLLTVSGQNAHRVFSIAAGKTVNIYDLTVANGAVAGVDGGGISNAGTLVLAGVHITACQTNLSGGGIANLAAATLTVVNSAITQNTATISGGGIHTAGTATLANSTFALNSVQEDGGAVANTGTLSVLHCTITDNTADSNTTGGGQGGGIHTAVFATLTGSIVAGNDDDSNGIPAEPTHHFDLSGQYNSGGYNLIGSVTGADILQVAGDQFGTITAPINPGLGSLALRGGATPNTGINIGSPALDMGDPSFNVSNLPAALQSFFATDQREGGYGRVVNSRIDIGAFEYDLAEADLTGPGGVAIPSGGSYSFGAVEVGATQTALFTITNNGTGSMTLGALSLPAGFTQISGFSSAVLPAGQSAAFEIGVDTSAAAALSGVLSFSTNDPDENPYVVTISATVQDTTPPVASIQAIAHVNAEQPLDFTVQVTYSDLSQIDAASIDKDDLTISGPGIGFPLTPKEVISTGLQNGSPLVVTYHFFQQGTSSAVARNWRWLDNGDYTINIAANQVLDTQGNAVLNSSPVIFKVNVPRPFALWQQRQFPNGSGGLLPNSGPLDDYDFDGDPNIFEYALGNDPKNAANNNMDRPLIYRDEFDGYQVKYSVYQHLTKDDLQMEIQASTDLVNWHPVITGVDVTAAVDGIFPAADPEYAPDYVQTSKRQRVFAFYNTRPDGLNRTFLRVQYTLLRTDGNVVHKLDPVGSLTQTALGDSDTNISIPFHRDPAFVGQVDSVSENVVTVKGNPQWAEGQFVYSAASQTNTYYVQFANGVKEGRWYPVTGNGTSTVTLNLAGDDVSVVVAGTKLKVVPYWTLSTVFPGGNGVHGRASIASLATEVLFPDLTSAGANLVASAVYFHYTGSSFGGSGWRKSGSSVTQKHDNVTVRPYMPLKLVNSISGSTSCAMYGHVQMNKNVLDLRLLMPDTDQDNAVALSIPVPLTPLQTNLFQSGAFVGTSSIGVIKDQLLIYDNALAQRFKVASRVLFYYTGTSFGGPGWRQSGRPVTEIVNNQPLLLPGQGFMIRKRRAEQPGVFEWSVTPEYISQ